MVQRVITYDEGVEIVYWPSGAVILTRDSAEELQETRDVDSR
jgi:hypothetical protein